MGKRDPYKFTLKFNAMDPMHRIAVKRLMTIDKAKATYIASLIINDLDRYSLLDEIKALPDPVPDNTARSKTGRGNYMSDREKPFEKQPEAHTESPDAKEEPYQMEVLMPDMMPDEENSSIIASTLSMFGDEEDEEV